MGVLEVTEILNQNGPIARNTVRTLMEGMNEKGCLTFRPEWHRYVYSAAVPREESLGQRVTELVDKACGGEPERLMMALLNYWGLSDEETVRIQTMLDEAKAKQIK